jgi:hypothetical protein
MAILKNGSVLSSTKWCGPGTDVMISKIFLPRKLVKKSACLTQNKAKLFKNLIVTLVFEKNHTYLTNLFAENCDHNIDPMVARFFSVKYTKAEKITK